MSGKVRDKSVGLEEVGHEKSQRQSTSSKGCGLTVVLQNLPLSLVDVTETNVDQPITLEERLAPAKLWDFFLAATLESEEERDGASVDVA